MPPYLLAVVRLAECCGQVEEPLRSFTLCAPFPASTRTPHHLVAPHETAVYRFYRHQGQLLYVGISWNPFKRWTEHRRRALWWPRGLASVLVEVYASERQALRVERTCIRNCKPLGNLRSAMK